MNLNANMLVAAAGLVIVALTPPTLYAQPGAAPKAAATAAVPSDPAGLSGFWKEPRPLRRGPPPGAGGPGAAAGAQGPPPGEGGAGAAGARPPGPGGGGPPRGPGAKLRAAAQGRLQPWAAQKLQEYDAALAAGRLPRTNANQCLPWAIPGIGIPGGIAYSMNIVARATEVVFMYELDHQARIVYLNQQHPANLTPSYFGHSVGHWEGSTLVVDSIGFNDKTEIFDGLAHTPALHVVERLSINRDGLLEDRVTFDDPGALKEPISFVDVFERAGPFQEYVCAENNHEAVTATER